MAGISINLSGNFSKLDELKAKTNSTASAVRNSFSGIRGGITAAFAGAAAPIAAFVAATTAAKQTMEATAEQDSLIRGLKSVEGTADATAARLEELRKVAKAPGLGFEEAVKGDIRLRAVGIAAEDSTDILENFGNALASVGGSSADLDGVILGLTQMASKGKISAEEINQIAERVPQVRQAMKDAFGTADTEALGRSGMEATEFIQGLVAELGKLPKVTGGAQNELDNYNDSWKGLKTEAAGFGELMAGPWIQTVSGVFVTARKDLERLRNLLGMKVPALQGPDGPTEAARMAERAAADQEAADRETSNAGVRLHNENLDFWTAKEKERLDFAKASAEAAAEKAAEEEKSRAMVADEYRLEAAIVQARLQGDGQRLAALNREKAIREEMAKLTGGGWDPETARKQAGLLVDNRAAADQAEKARGNRLGANSLGGFAQSMNVLFGRSANAGLLEENKRQTSLLTRIENNTKPKGQAPVEIVVTPTF